MRSLAVLLCLTLIPSLVTALNLPEVTTDKQAWPSEIFLAGTGVPDEAEVTLTVEGIGDTTFAPTIDLMFIIDVSGSMAGQPLADAQRAAAYICNRLNDYPGMFSQSGLISFGTNATLLRQLSSDHRTLVTLILGLVANGYTAMGDAINLAQEELTGPRHRDGNLRVILLISDGSSNVGSDPLEAAQNAKATGTLIYALGIGNPVEDQIMRTVVSEPDSLNYWYYPDPSKYDEIVERMHTLPTYLAARQLTVNELLDSRFSVVPGSFSIAPDSTLGELRRWNVGELGIDQTWTVTFRVTASDTGLLPVDQLPVSRANYMNFAGAWMDTPFPQAYINVIMGVGVEEAIGPREGESIFEAGPNPFHDGLNIAYFSDGSSRVRVVVHDLAGRLIKTLVDEIPSAGSHTVVWRGDDDFGTPVARGAYVCRYEMGDQARSKIVLYMR